MEKAGMTKEAFRQRYLLHPNISEVSLALEDDDLPVVLRRNVRPRLHRQHGEGLAQLRRFAPDAGNGNLAALRKALTGKN